jgi:hypothetical protein
MNNKLIADFLVWDVNNPSTFPTELHQEEGLQGFWELRFDTDWNWLMVAVEKIENITINNITFDVFITKEKTHIHYSKNSEWFSNIFLHEGNTKIENTYNAVVEFINFYNKLK